MIKDKYGRILGTSFNEIAMLDLGMVGVHATKLCNHLGNWAALEKLPLSHWQDKADKGVTLAVLEIRKEIDVKKFREPAISELQDLNRCLASLRLGAVELSDFISPATDM